MNQKFYITFAPTDTGAATGHIYFYHNAPTSPDQLTVTGKGVTPVVDVSTGWNIVSLPYSVSDPRKSEIFPTAISDAFRYDGGPNYVISDSMTGGRGYWLKFSSNQSLGIIGYPPTTDTIDVVEGWNLIGSTLNTVSVGSIQSIPEDIILSNYFNYNRSYSTVDSLRAGQGYWVKVGQAGKLILGNFSAALKLLSSHDELQYFNKLIVRDSKGNSQVLYFGKGIDSTADYPLTLEWEMKQSDIGAMIMMGNQKVVLNGRGTIQIPYSSIDIDRQVTQIILHIGGSSELPKVFALEQNHPNPFNPSTVINYSLPLDSWVTLKVFDVLGREISTLVNEHQSAGYHTVTFSTSIGDANKLSSGLYFYRLQTWISSSSSTENRFTEIKKMLLLQ
ncbi:MAG: T9SS type A sorting domain-containing protein [Ignavibacteriales bacterium]|nr:T9SS type A sorting domain-containing protein [Ignavibacteriales bacterium]